MSSGPLDAGATSINEVDTQADRDAQAIFERKLAANKNLKEKGEDDKVYRGLNNYQSFYEKRDTAQGNAASGNVRCVIIIFLRKICQSISCLNCTIYLVLFSIKIICLSNLIAG